MPPQKTDDFIASAGYETEFGWFPRVTRIIEIKSKPSLYHFYSTVGFKNGNQIKNQSAAEGTLVHETAEQILLGRQPDINPKIAPAISALKNFLSQHHIETYPELIEKRIIHPYFRYAGTADAVIKLNGRLGLLDLKTSQSIYRDYNLQTAAYFDALKEEMPELSARWILRLDQIETCLTCGATRRLKGGREKINKPFPYNNGMCSKDNHNWSDLKGIAEIKEANPAHSSDFEAFLGAKRLWEWENEFILKKIGYL